MTRLIPALAFTALLAAALPAAAQEYHDIDVDLPAYPEMQPVEDLPVYYAPNVDSNYFFYDGLYWDYNNDGWYSSPWYNGPWTFVDPVYVPTYILWVPVRYYHHRPGYWNGWAGNRPPRWGAHWGPRWQENHNRVYAGGGTQRGVERAPLPNYQRQFTRANYPRAPQQQYQLHAQQYNYQPREHIVRQQYQSGGMPTQGAVAAQARGGQSHHDEGRHNERH